MTSDLEKTLFPVAFLGKGVLSLVLRPDPDLVQETTAFWAKKGLTHIMSMLEGEETEHLGLSEEDIHCARNGLVFEHFPIRDYTVPEDTKACETMAFSLRDKALAGAHIGFHCRGTTGRSPMILASVLVSSGLSVTDSWRRIRTARGVPVPDTDEQVTWLAQFAERIASERV